MKNMILLLFVFFVNLNWSYSQSECSEISNKKAKKAFEEGVDKYMSALKARSGKAELYGEATQALKKAIEIEPEYADAFFVLGELNMKQERVNVAETYLRKCYDLCANYPDMNLFYYLGDIASGQKRWADAERFLAIFLKDVDKIKSDNDYKHADYMYKRAKTLNEIYSHPVAFNPKVVKGISTAKDEYLPIITPDGEIAFYTRRVEKPKSRGVAEQETQYVERFSMSNLTESGEFDEGEPLPPPFNKSLNEGGATLTIDNKYLFYNVCAWRKVTGGEYYNCDLCMTEYVDGEWKEIMNMGQQVNKVDTWEAMPTISADGKTIFFVSDRPGGLGGYDIYKTEKNAKGEWGPATNLGAPINTPGNERAPFIHTDSQTLYFSSSDRYDEETRQWYEGHLGLGGYDIFYSKMNGNNTWQKPKNIGYPINTEEDETGFFVSTDGKLGYFASKRENLNGKGGWDLYCFDLYKEARPDKVLFLKGDVKEASSNEPIRAKVELIGANSKKVTEIPVDSVSGKYVVAMRFEEDMVMTVKKDGYAYNAKYIAKEDSVYQAPKKLDFDVQKIEVGASYKLNDIYFATKSTDLTNPSKIIINGFIEFLKKNPTIEVAIHGHTDDVGEDLDNMTLSEGRAKSVYDYMISQGIVANRLTYKGFGETKPIAKNDSDIGRAKNRRTEFLITSK